MQKFQLLVGIGGDDAIRIVLLLGSCTAVLASVHPACAEAAMRTFIFDAVPKPRETHELPVLPLHVVGYLVFPIVLFDPLIEALADDYAPLPFLHRGPHPSVFDQRIVASVDCSQYCAVIRTSLRPRRNQA